MEIGKKIKSILFISVLSLICLSLAYVLDVNDSLGQAESSIEVEPQEIKKAPFPPETAGPEYAPDEILVKFKPGVKRSLMAEIHARFGMVKIREIERIGVHRLKIPPGRTVPQMVEEYRRNPNVEYAEPNYVARKYAIPDDPYYINQWAFYQPNDADIDAQEAWDIETGTSTIIIAIIDDGIDYNHEEFPLGKLWINPSTGQPGYDFGVSDDDVMHESATGGHGTCTAGIATAATDNGLGVAGTCWNATIMPLKVEDGAGDILYSYLADAITFAADNGAHILSMSLGGTSDSATLRDACDYAWDIKGKVVLASSGNENISVSYPAAYSTTIAVGATNESDERCTTVDWGGGQGSNYGSELDVVAPGNNIYTPDWSGTNGYVSGDYYAGFGGTSASCPMAAGVTALILSQNPSLTNIQVRDLLRSTAEDLVGDPSEDTEGFDNYYGYGRINAYYALLGSPPPISKIVFITPPRSAPVNSASEVMTIQTQDSIGSPIAVSSDTAINLISTSGTGKFSLSASSWSDIISLTISKGKKSASFYYKDSTVGTPTITVSESPDAGWTDATQEVHITFSQPDLTLTGTTDIEFSNQTPEPLEVITISATIHNNGASYHNQNIDTTPFAEVTSGGTSGYYVDVTQWDGQSFTATSDGWLAKVSIAAWDVNADVTDPERFFQVRIQGDDSGKPDGNDLSSVESYDFAGSWEWHDFVFSKPARIVSGAKYWIVANSLAPDTNGYAWRFGGPPDAYKGSGANVEDTSDSSVIWGTESSKEDFWFKTYTYTYNTIVQFYDGNPDNGGTQIGSDQNLGPIPSIETDIASVNWTAAEGTHQIYVHVDRPNYITEADDTNNKAYKTITIVAPTISSATNQTFTVGDPATAISTITITDDPSNPTITAANDIRIKIPATFNMEWDTSDTIATIGGGAASKVSTTVSYEDSNKTLVIDVTTDFAASDSITVSDLSFKNFSDTSAADNLELEVDNAGTTVAYDDKTITIRSLAGWTAYNDCGDSGNTNYDSDDPNVTNFGAADSSGNLKKYSDGSDTGVSISYSGNLNEGLGAENEHTPPCYPPSGDAATEFGTKINVAGISYCTTGNSFSVTLSGVSSSKKYTLVALGMRGNSTYDRESKYVISDVSSFTNSSSAGTTISTTNMTDDTTIYHTDDNWDEGYVAKWTNIVPTSNSIVFTVYPVDTVDDKGYLSAIKLVEEGVVDQTNVSKYASGIPTVPPSTVDKGTTGNCLGTFKFDGSGTVSEITITEYGTCDAINDLDNVKLFKDDGDGNWELGEDTTQLGSTTTFSGASSTATFSGFSLVAYSTCYVHVVLDVKNTATLTDTIGIEISASTDVTSTKYVTAYSWPVQLGTSSVGPFIDVSNYTGGSPSVPPGTVYKQSTENCLGTFRFDGSGTISQITIIEYGTCDALSDLENVKLFQDDGDGNWESGADTTQLGSTINFNSSNEATFSSLDITASGTCYVHVVLDVNSNAIDGETVGIELYQDDIVCTSTTTASGWPVQLGTSNIATYTAGATVAFICDARPRLFGDGESQLTDDLNQMDDQMGSGWTLNAVVTTGDMDYISETGQQTFDDAYAVSDVNTTPVFYAVGNHEIDNSYDMPVLRDKFSGYSFSPNSGPANCEETTYSYDVGDIHVAVINEYYNGTSDTGTNGDVVNELFDWLKDDLRTTTKPYKVVAAHEPAYPEAWQRHVGDSLDGYPDNRDRFWNLLKTERALAYFCGHTHIHKFQEYDGVFECDAGVSGGMVGGSGYDDFATIFYAHFDETDGFQIRAVKEDPNWASPTVVTKTRADLETQVMVNTAERAGTRCSYFIDYDESNPDWSGNNSSKWWESAFSTATANWSSGELCVGYDTTLAWPWMNTAIDNKSGVYGVFVRVPFTCYDKSSYYGMKLQVDCDDAVTVWLNGTQIYKTANSPDVGADDIWDKTASSAHTADGDADKNPDYANGTFDITSYLSSLNEGSNLLVIGNWNSATTSSDLAAGIKLSLTKEVTTTIVSGYHDGTPTVPPSYVNTQSTGNCLGTFKFDGAGTISQITITEYGTSDATTELENVKLFQDDGDGDWEPSQDTTQIGSATTFSGASSTATFSGFNLTVGAACYVHVVLDVKSTATQDNTIGIEILQASDVTSTKSVTASSWPVQLGTSTIKDATAPESITTLTAQTGTIKGEIDLTWTSPGDDGITGDIVGGKYRVQYSTDANVIWDKDNYDIEWSTDTFPGAHQAKTVTGLIQGTTYYFSIWTADEVPNWSSLSNSATSQSQVAILSISVSTDTYNFGEIPVSSSAVSITSVIVTNNGNVNQTYSLKCSTSNPGHLSPIVTSPGWDEFRLSTIFNSTATSEDFVQNDALTLESQTSSGSVFAKDEEGDQTGVNVPVDEDRNLWLKFESPWKTAETAEQEITVTISAEMAE